MEKRPLCDTALIKVTTGTEGYTQPLLLAPSIFYRGDRETSLYKRIEESLEGQRAERVIDALKRFFGCPGIAVTYWKPRPGSHPFRVDLSASSLGHPEPWGGERGNRFVEEESDLAQLEGVLNHLGYWFCNDVEYNIPLSQADTLARFDRDLYQRKYEPFIIHRLEQAGYDITGSRRMLREVDG
jgi:hypothetical protein